MYFFFFLNTPPRLRRSIHNPNLFVSKQSDDQTRGLGIRSNDFAQREWRNSDDCGLSSPIIQEFSWTRSVFSVLSTCNEESYFLNHVRSQVFFKPKKNKPRVSWTNKKLALALGSRNCEGWDRCSCGWLLTVSWPNTMGSTPLFVGWRGREGKGERLSKPSPWPLAHIDPCRTAK